MDSNLSGYGVISNMLLTAYLHDCMVLECSLCVLKIEELVGPVYIVTGSGVMSCVCVMAFQSGSTTNGHVSLLQTGTATL